MVYDYIKIFLIVKSQMKNFSYLIRIKSIYKALRNAPCDIQTLMNILKDLGIAIQKRQVYRDLLAIQYYFIRDDETFVCNFVNERKQFWRILPASQDKQINSDLHFSYLLFKQTAPILFDDIQKDFFDQTADHFFNNNLLPSLSSSNNNQLNIVIETKHYFHKKYCLTAYELFKDLSWCIENYKKISINKIRIDATGNAIYFVPVIFVPVKFIIHKGAIYIVGVSKKKLMAFELMEILSYHRLKINVKKDIKIYREFVDNELKKRFGLAENIDHLVYDIDLLLSFELGSHLSSFDFHPTQKIKKTTDGYWFQYKCGINRELISWIGMWVGEIQIIQPEKLKTIFIKKMEKTKKEMNGV